ncbi:MAG: cobalamin-dependent protein [Phycisphaerales bacterium]|nr:cobalamin-dependent protein [Phycisphaerales bacterium]
MTTMSMSSAEKFAAEVLRQSANALAAMTTERMFQEQPGIAARYQPNPSLKWRENVSGRVHYLAAAVATGRPHVFLHQAKWDKVAHSARGGEAACADLMCSMRCLRSVIGEELPPAARPVVLECVDAAIATMASASTESHSLLNPSTPTGRLAAEYLLAILEGDRQRACMMMLDAVTKGRADLGMPPLSVVQAFSQVLSPVQQELGRMWHINESTVAEEHFATATTHTVMSAMYPHMPRAPRNGKAVLCAAVETNAHEVGVRMVADVLEMHGWRSVYLGQNVPIDDLVLAAEDFRVDLVALSATLLTHLPLMGETIRRMRAGNAGNSCGLKILVGGSAFTADPDQTVWQNLGADAYARNLDEAVAAAGRLCGV